MNVPLWVSGVTALIFAVVLVQQARTMFYQERIIVAIIGSAALFFVMVSNGFLIRDEMHQELERILTHEYYEQTPMYDSKGVFIKNDIRIFTEQEREEARNGKKIQEQKQVSRETGSGDFELCFKRDLGEKYGPEELVACESGLEAGEDS